MATGSQYDLVSFDRPPVKEVVLSMQFPPDSFDLETFGAFAKAVHQDMPERQRHPVLPPIQEMFGPASLPSALEIRLEQAAVMPRIWFLTADGTYVAQLQHDRLTLNWRENGTGHEYPRYTAIRQRYRDLLGLVLSHANQGRSTPTANLCEVAYVNPVLPVPPADEPGNHRQLASALNRVGVRPTDAFLPPAEDAQLFVRWRIPGSEMSEPHDGPIGRLYLQAGPGLRPPDPTPIYVINLTAHVIPIEGEIDGALAALDVAHRWVVLGFRDVTTPEMHEEWGLREKKS